MGGVSVKKKGEKCRTHSRIRNMAYMNIICNVVSISFLWKEKKKKKRKKVCGKVDFYTRRHTYLQNARAPQDIMS